MHVRTSFTASVLGTLLAMPLAAQVANQPGASAQQAGAPRQSGTVKAVTPQDFVLTTAAGQDIAVTVPAGAKILLVDPATRDVKTAQSGTMADIAGGDKAIVTGSAGDTGQAMTATRVYLLKSGALAALHAQQQAAWARSVGGIVKSLDPAAGTIAVVNGTRSYTVDTTPKTVVRRYAAGSVRFEDAVQSNVAAIQPGDQLQARGQHSSDGVTVNADEIVTGSFSNYSGLLTGVDPAAGTVTLKDLATKKSVTVTISKGSNLRHLSPGAAQGMAERANAGGQAAPGQPADRTGAAPATPNRTTGGGQQAGASSRPGGGRMDLSRIVNRLPTEAIADLKPGEAVMIVASNNPGGGLPTAVTMVSGVDAILAASPNGQTTLSPWSLGSGQGEEGGEGGGGAAEPAGGSGGR